MLGLPLRALLSILACVALALPNLAQEPGFAGAAQELRQAEKWGELAELVSPHAEEAAAAEGRPLALAFLSVARAGSKDFDGASAALLALREAGQDPAAALPGFGVPAEATLNGIWAHCWSNFGAEANRGFWQAYFDVLEATPYARVPASRLLMAALKLEDAEATAKLEAWWDARVDAYRTQGGPLGLWVGAYGKAYVLAGVGGPRVMELCNESFALQWEAAIKEHDFDPTAEALDLAKQEACDLDCDDAYNNLAHASVLSGAYTPETSALAAREAEPGARFAAVTEELGLAGVRNSRIAVGDYDADGWPDLCFQGRLFRNERGERFVEVTQELGIAPGGNAALFLDFDADGKLDILIARSPHPRLFRNLGKREDFRFVEVTEEAGLSGLSFPAGPEGVAVYDCDGDLWPDLYFAIYEQPMATGHPDVLMRNTGKGGFENWSETSGVAAASGYCGRGVTACDYDLDGDQDLYVSNYRLQRNLLFELDEDGSLVDRAEALQLHGVRQPADGQYYGHTIGSCWGDIDNDGDFDLFAANLAHPRFVRQGFSNLSMLYINQGEAGGWAFSEERQARGIRFQETHSDPAFADYDNDGDLDLSITNIYEGVPSALFQNDGQGSFAPVSFRARAVAFNGWGQAWLDYDQDGDLDLLIASGSGCELFRNEGNEHHWLRIALEGKKPNRTALGARVRVTTIDAEVERSWVRELRAGRGTSSQDEPVLHFGLGDWDGRVSIEVWWPGESRPQKRNARVDRVVEIAQR
ncbi:MAG: hypothetical protein CMJ94_10970 [Planctomycetes bacterium]|nr:hypothetical protein [Planctomycetota bacterium]